MRLASCPGFQERSQAEYDVAKQRCDDQVGDAKDACQQQAKAQRDQALAQAKMQSQSQGAGQQPAAGATK